MSALGMSKEQVWESYQNSDTYITKDAVHENWICKLNKPQEAALESLKNSDRRYQKLDRSVLLALMAAQGLKDKIQPSSRLGINIGSSRGATELFERYHQDFLAGENLSPFTSPTTTLGNISSWVAQDLGIDGLTADHSVTCSTALHALLNGLAWIKSGMIDSFIAGGSEAPLTKFTIEQMKALKLYSSKESGLPCESMNFQKDGNTMVLGEAAALCVLERGLNTGSRAVISGYGFASEILTHGSSISENALCFQRSMRRALQQAEMKSVNAVVMHAPGTIKGDLAEWNAIAAVFGEKLPALTSNKWKIGHTLGASGMMSLEMAVLMLEEQCLVPNPFYKQLSEEKETLNHIMVNAVGFGGNAVSIIISKP